MLANPTHTISSSLVQVFLVGGSSKYLHMVVKTAQSKHTACPCNYIVRMREDLTLLPCVAYSPRAGGRVLVCIPGRPGHTEVISLYKSPWFSARIFAPVQLLNPVSTPCHRSRVEFSPHIRYIRIFSSRRVPYNNTPNEALECTPAMTSRKYTSGVKLKSLKMPIDTVTA